MQQNASNFNLSWNSYDNYWICLALADAHGLHLLEKDLKNNGLIGISLGDKCLAIAAPRDWKEIWDILHESITLHNFINPLAAVIGVEKKQKPTLTEVMPYMESIGKIDTIAKNLWLGEAILNQRVEIHYQPIVDRSREPFGYEAFARIRRADGEMVSGGRIFEAARETNIHHVLDKHLQILSIKTFAEAKLPGNLFINFMTGFIQLPGKYLEGLTEATKQYDLLAKRLVLGVSESQNVHDIEQISSVIDFSSSKGYAVALDDITSLFSLQDILQKTKLKPDFIKLDRKITHESSRPSVTREIMAITQLAHERGSMVIAEAIEDAETYKSLMNCGVDLFQGYYFSAPMTAKEIKLFKKSA